MCRRRGKLLTAKDAKKSREERQESQRYLLTTNDQRPTTDQKLRAATGAALEDQTFHNNLEHFRAYDVDRIAFHMSGYGDVMTFMSLQRFRILDHQHFLV